MHVSRHAQGGVREAESTPTLSNRPDVSTPTSASCGISYADGSVWRQTVTVTFGGEGKPVADWTNLGTELLLPTGG